jgi:hypothetical protein
MTISDLPTLSFSCEMDARAFYEIELKGFFQHTLVNLPDGTRVRVSFWDPIRLSQDLKTATERGKSCIAEPCIIILPKITLANMTAAVEELYRSGYFERLRAAFQYST